MMVNQMSNSGTPWPSTIPNQMPWLNSIPTSTPMQFGQVGLGSDPSLISPAPIQPITPRIVPSQIAPLQISNPLYINPFEPVQQVASQPTVENVVLPPNQTNVGANNLVQSGPFESSFLTQLPQNSYAPCSQPLQQKRSSVEMEDELTVKEAPPTKQQLSESRLFKRFGSLQLDNDAVGGNNDDEVDSDDSDEGRSVYSQSHNRSEFNRYVYLLFKDKKSNNLFDDSTSRAMDRLLREERDKLNKAVILWNPPMRDFYVSEVADSDDDEEITYTDHKDFLKKKSGEDDSIIITEVEDDVEIEDGPALDDVMQD